jgi:hypothetical protein
VEVTQDQQTFVTADMPFTVSRDEIQESLKGSMRTGDINPTVEIGGVYSPYLNGDMKQGEQPQLGNRRFISLSNLWKI